MLDHRTRCCIGLVTSNFLYKHWCWHQACRDGVKGGKVFQGPKMCGGSRRHFKKYGLTSVISYCVAIFQQI